MGFACWVQVASLSGAPLISARCIPKGSDGALQAIGCAQRFLADRLRHLHRVQSICRLCDQLATCATQCFLRSSLFFVFLERRTTPAVQFACQNWQNNICVISIELELALLLVHEFVGGVGKFVPFSHLAVLNFHLVHFNKRRLFDRTPVGQGFQLTQSEWISDLASYLPTVLQIGNEFG